MILKELSLAELVCIGEALANARMDIGEVHAAIFGGIIGAEAQAYPGEYNDDQVEQALAIIDSISNVISDLIAHDGGVILIQG